MENNTSSAIKPISEVESCCNNDLKVIFQTLLLQKKAKQQELADFCEVDKSYISKVIHGYYYPELRMRLKIASFFGCDTTLIWHDQEKNKDLLLQPTQSLAASDSIKKIGENGTSTT